MTVEPPTPAVTLSIIILNHNSGSLLVACLDSLFADTFPFSIEVIVPDNASTDDSLQQAIDRWGPRIRCLHNGANKGFAWGNNRGMAQAVGKFVCLLNPDTIIYPGAFPTLIEFMEQHPKAGFAGPKVLNRDGSFQLSAKRSIPTPLDAIYRAVGLSRLFPNSRRFARYNVTYLHPDETQAVDACTGCCIVARQEMLDQIGLLDEGYFIYCEDVDWFVRAKKAHWEVWYVAAAVIEHHHAYSAAFRKRQAVVDFHHSMTRFYRKHLAADYPAVFNAFIYLAVWLRMHLMIVYKSLRGWQ
jgi:GT2 family glycosyltransferase